MQSIEKINLTKLKKCNQVWEDMTPSEKGRICSKCQNTIIDFRNQTDREVAETHTFTTGKVCGLYKKEQLQLKTTHQKRQSFKSIYIGLIGIFSSISLTGLAKGNMTPIEQVEPDYEKQTSTVQKTKNIPSPVTDTIVISGFLTDEAGGKLIAASVHIKDTKIGTNSDINGFYRLNISKALKKDSKITLVVSYLGYVPLEIIIKKKDILNNRKTLDLTLLEGEEVIAFYIVEKQPWYKRVWGRIKRIFTKKKK
jgi:hypothetical protein